MVQLDKVQGNQGHLIIHEDGTIVSSSGDLASNESTAQQITSLLSHSFPVNFFQNNGGGSGGSAGGVSMGTNEGLGVVVAAAGTGSRSSNTNFSSNQSQLNGSGMGGSMMSRSGTSGGGGDGSGPGGPQPFKWTRLTIAFPDKSFVACLSNRRIHVVKRRVDPSPSS